MLRGVGWVLDTGVSGKHSGSTFKGPGFKKSFWAARRLKVGLIGCTKTSVTKYQLGTRNVPEKRRFQLPAARAWYLAFRMLKFCVILELNLKGNN